MKIEKCPKASSKAAAELAETLTALKPLHAAGVLNYLVPTIRIITTSRDESNACVVLYSEEVLNQLKSIAAEIRTNFKDLSPLAQANKFMLKVADGRFKFRTDTVTASFAIVDNLVKKYEGMYTYPETQGIISRLIENIPYDTIYIAVFYANQVYVNDALKKKLYEQFNQLAEIKREQVAKLKETRIQQSDRHLSTEKNGQSDLFPNEVSGDTIKALADCYVRIMNCCKSGWIKNIARNIVAQLPDNCKNNVSVLVRTYAELLTDAKNFKTKNGCGIEAAIQEVMRLKFNINYKPTTKYPSVNKTIVVKIRQNSIELDKTEAKSIVEQLFNTADNAIVIRGVRIILSQIEKKQLVFDIMRAM